MKAFSPQGKNTEVIDQDMAVFGFSQRKTNLLLTGPNEVNQKL